MASLKLRLTATRYDQPEQLNDADSPTVIRTQGEVFEANSQEEYDRLIAAEAAEDPDEVVKRQQEELERRQAELDAQKEALDAEFEAQTPPDQLKGKALDDALEAAGLSTDGKVADKQQRLAEYQAANPPA